MDFARLPTGAADRFCPFQVHVPNEDIEHLSSLLSLSRLGRKTYESSFADRRLGLDRSWLEQAVNTWKTTFDWLALCDAIINCTGLTLSRCKQEQFINSFPAFKASIDLKSQQGSAETYDVHFVALFSQKPDAIPLLLLHGWPG
jgi:microsomal epoxide hydrolase